MYNKKKISELTMNHIIRQDGKEYNYDYQKITFVLPVWMKQFIQDDAKKNKQTLSEYLRSLVLKEVQQ